MSEENKPGGSSQVPAADDAGKTDPPKSDPSGSDDGKSQKKPAEAHSNIPDNLKGKNPEELAKMYSDLETKIGENSGELGELRKYKSDMGIVLSTINSDQTLFDAVDKAVKKTQGVGVTDKSKKPGKSDEGADKDDGKVDEIRKSQQDQVIRNFQGEYGLDKLPQEERKEMGDKISQELAELLDPNGNTPLNLLLDKVALGNLPIYLDKAYWLANKQALVDKGTINPDLASIGSMASGSDKSKSNAGLSNREMKMADNLGVSQEKYAKQKKNIFG